MFNLQIVDILCSYQKLLAEEAMYSLNLCIFASDSDVNGFSMFIEAWNMRWRSSSIVPYWVSGRCNANYSSFLPINSSSSPLNGSCSFSFCLDFLHFLKSQNPLPCLGSTMEYLGILRKIHSVLWQPFCLFYWRIEEWFSAFPYPPLCSLFRVQGLLQGMLGHYIFLSHLVDPSMGKLRLSWE